MSNNNIIRAWKDEDYFDSLSEEERVLVPENPAGIVEMSNEEMESIAGGGCRNNNTNGCNVVSNNCNITNDNATCTSFFCG